MTSIPAAGYFTDSLRTNLEAKEAQDDMLEVAREQLGGQVNSELTIASGSVTPTSAYHTIDTETDASSDNLDAIAQTNLPDGHLLLIRCQDNSRSVVVRHNIAGTGKIVLYDAANLTLNDVNKFLLLYRNGTQWDELIRGYGNDKAAARAFLGLGTAALQNTGQSGTNVPLLSAANVWGAGQAGAEVTLTDGATVTPDFALANNFKWTIGGSRTLANPSNIAVGQSGRITITQDGTGNRVISYGSWYKFASDDAGNAQRPPLSTGAAEIDVLTYEVLTTTSILCSLSKKVQ